MPWVYPQDLAKALRELLTVARSAPDADPAGELPAKIEYLGVQYLSRSYIGTFEIAREQPDNYIGQDERQLVPQIDEELAKLDAKANGAVAKLKTRWKFLRAALQDMNSGSNALSSASGRGVVWAERFVTPLADVMHMRATLASEIVAALEPRIQISEAMRAARIPTDRLDAWSAYHRGLWHMYRFNRDDNAVASGFFARAVALDPAFARAHAGLSFTHFQNAFLNFAPDAEGERRKMRIASSDTIIAIPRSTQSPTSAPGPAPSFISSRASRFARSLSSR